MSARGATPAESVGHLLKKPKYSRKINYNAVATIFKSPAAISKIGKAPMSSWDQEDGDWQGEEKDDQDAMETIDPDTDVGSVTSRVYNASDGDGYGGGGVGHDGDGSDYYGQDDFYDDGGYQEEV